MTIHVSTGELDLERRRFLRRDGTEAVLTAIEAALLGFLAERIGEDVSRDDLLAEVWGHHAASLSRAVDCAVKRLRKKIEEDDGPPRALLTVHGVGYRLVGAAPALTVVPTPAVGARLLCLGHVDVDLDSGVLRAEDDRAPLTTQQLTLLRVLADQPGQAVSACTIARRLGLSTHARRAVNTAVYRLRQAIEVDPSNPELVVHLRGRGFLLQPPDTAEAPVLADVERTLWRLARHAGTVLGFDDCVVYVRDGVHLVQAAAWGPKSPEEGTLFQPIALRLGEGIVGSSAAGGRPIYVPDTRLDPRYVPDAVEGRSELAVPIAWDGRVVGVIDSESATPAAYGLHQREALASIADLAGAAVADVWRARRRAS